MVRLQRCISSNERGTDDNNSNSEKSVRKMALGDEFDYGDDGLLKEFQPFLRPRKMDSYNITAELVEEERVGDMNSSPSSASTGFSQNGSISPLPAIRKSVSSLVTGVADGMVCIDNESLDRELMVQEFLNQQPIQCRGNLHRRCNSASGTATSVTPCKKPMGHFRHSSLNSNRKSMRSSTRMGGNLRKMSTVDSSGRDTCKMNPVFSRSGPGLNNHSAPCNISRRKAMKSRLSQSSISHFYDENSPSDIYPRITPETLRTIIEYSIHKPQYDSVCIVDCRFEYEFKGGHIASSLNICSREGIELEFIREIRPFPTLLIFYCEFSAYRSPLMASHLRNFDRISNYEEYPNLFYPDILILEGGYKRFFDKFPHLCFPCDYVRMDSTENLNNRDQELEKFRQDSKKMISRNGSSRRLATASTPSLFNSRQQSSHKRNNSISFFKCEPAQHKHSLSKHGNSPFLSSDESCSSSRASTSPNLSSSKMLASDTLDLESCYSFEDSETTFTTPLGSFGTPTTKTNGGPGGTSGSYEGMNSDHYNKHDFEYTNNPLSPVKRSLFPDILLEEENEKVE